MERRLTQPRTSFAAAGHGPAAPDVGLRRDAARRLPRALALLLAPFAALGALLAGLLFVIVLPVCGIGSIAEGIARAAWGFVRSALHPRAGADEAHGLIVIKTRPALTGGSPKLRGG